MVEPATYPLPFFGKCLEQAGELDVFLENGHQSLRLPPGGPVAEP